jgi:TRAP-type mannitol/chloroaromatic compound transport system permease small subunit
MRAVLRVIDSVSEHIGSWGRWIVVALIAITFWDVLLRYVFGHATMWVFEASMMMGGAIGAAGWAYAQRRGLHIRIDVIYTNLSPRTQAIINIIGTLVFFLPLFVLLIITASEWVIMSWARHEVWQEGFWFPPAGPSRTVVLIGLVALFFQVLASFYRDLYFLVKGTRP